MSGFTGTVIPTERGEVFFLADRKMDELRLYRYNDLQELVRTKFRDTEELLFVSQDSRIFMIYDTQRKRTRIFRR